MQKTFVPASMPLKETKATWLACVQFLCFPSWTQHIVLSFVFWEQHLQKQGNDDIGASHRAGASNLHASYWAWPCGQSCGRFFWSCESKWLARCSATLQGTRDDWSIYPAVSAMRENISRQKGIAAKLTTPMAMNLGFWKNSVPKTCATCRKMMFLLHMQDCNTGAQQASKLGSSYRTIYLLQNCIPAVWHAWSQLALQRKAVLFCMVQWVLDRCANPFKLTIEVLTLLKNFVMVAYDSGTCSGTWRTTEDQVFIYTSSIKCSLVYSNLSNDRILGLVALAFSKLKEKMFAENHGS